VDVIEAKVGMDMTLTTTTDAGQWRTQDLQTGSKDEAPRSSARREDRDAPRAKGVRSSPEKKSSLDRKMAI